MEPYIAAIAALAVVVLLYWAASIFLRKRFVILYHSQALTELTTELRRCANALEKLVGQERAQPEQGTEEKVTRVSSSMFGR